MTQTGSQAETLKKLYIELKKSKEKLRQMEEARNEPIAIIGMGCRFPGGAHDPDAFWELLKEGRDAVRDVPPERWDPGKYYDPDPKVPGKMYTIKGGFLTCPVDGFDAAFFNISPKEARAMDPQQRLLLEVTWEALEDAGLDVSKLGGSQTGVFIGISSDDYNRGHLHSDRIERIDAYSLTGVTFSTAAGRISYRFGFEGPCIAVDTACSSAFAAIHYAIHSLRKAESDMAIVGGVNLILGPENHICFSKMQAISPDGKCKTFDASANGYARGEGCGVVVIKRFSDAIKHGDRVLAVIRGSALNQDGKSSGFTAPNGKSQEKVLQQALEDAGLSPADIDYIEAHGTGTALGDPIEVEALGNVYGKDRSPGTPLLIASVKTNIGHLEPAAGISGLIKVVLALRREALPASLHFKTPHPYIPWDVFPVEVVTRLTPWKPGKKKRRAGISAFGFSGTNAHVIVEEAPAVETPGPGESHPEPAAFPLNISAMTPGALKELARQYAGYLSADSPGIGDICYTARVGRSHFFYRLSVNGETKEEIRDKLAAYCEGETGGVVTGEEKEDKKIAFLFTGQGSQYAGMGRGLLENHPIFRTAVHTCDRLFRPLLDRSIMELLYAAEEDNPLLDQTNYTQPVIFTIEYALAQLWKSWGVVPSAVVGHSIGELAAAVIAGIMSLEDGVRLTAARGRLMQSAPGNGSMGVIMADEQTVSTLIEPYRHSLSIAAVNAEKNISISGETNAVETVLANAAKKGYKTRPLSVSHAFHSPLMGPILEEFKTTAASVTFSAPPAHMVYISAMDGKPVENQTMGAGYWTRQVRETVRFYDALKTLETQGYELFLEIGSAPILSSLGAQIVTNPRCIFVPSLRKGQKEREQVLTALGQLYASGVSIDWQGFERPYPGHKVSLPTYPFQREKYWMELVTGKDKIYGRIGTENVYHPLIGQKITSPLLDDSMIYQSAVSARDPYFMQEHIIFGTAVSPAAAHVSMLVSAAKDIAAADVYRLENVEFISPLAVDGDTQKTVQIAIQEIGSHKKRFRVISRENNPGESDWDTNCTGFIVETGTAQAKKPPISIDELKERCPGSIDASQLYNTLWDLGYHLGTGFQRIRQVWKGKDEGICKLDLTKVEDIPDYPVYEIYPGFIDSIFQTLIPISDTCLDNMINNKKIYIPISISGLTYRKPFPDVIWCHATGLDNNESIVQGNVTVYNEQGEVLLEIERLAAKQTSRDKLLAGKEKDYKQMFYSLHWEEKELEVNRDRDLQNIGIDTCVIFSQQEDAAAGKLEEVFSQLLPETASIKVSKGAHYHRALPGAYTIDPSCKEDFSRLFKGLFFDKEIPVSSAVILYLWGLDNDTDTETEVSGEEQQDVCGGLVNIIRVLVELQLSRKAKLWVITKNAQDMEDIEGKSQGTAIWQAPLWGLGRTAALEYPDLWGGLIDIDDKIIDTRAVNIPREIAAGKEEQVCLREDGKRYVARLDKVVKGNDSLAAADGEINPDGTYLITGGPGALGLEMARWMVNKGCGHLVLNSRSSPTAAAQTVIAELNQDGAKVIVKTGDVSREADVLRLLGEIRETMPPLRGIIHAAGILDDGMLAEQNRERFQRVFAPKVQGAWNLHRATRDMPLDMFVMFSSGAAWMGSPGQGNYAAANEFLNGLARYRRNRGLPALSINWGPWAGKGMAVLQRNRGDRLSGRGIHSIPPEHGLKILEKLLAADSIPPCIMVMEIDWTRYSQYMLQKQKSGLFSNFVDGAAAEKSPAVHGKEGILMMELRGAAPQERREITLSHVRKLAGKVLGYSNHQQVAADKPLVEQGADSLMAVEMRNRLGEALGIMLSVTLLYDHPTLEKITNFLLNDVLSFDDSHENNEPGEGEKEPEQSAEELLEEINSLLES